MEKIRAGSSKFRFLIVLSVLWLIISLLIVTGTSYSYWEFYDYALSIFLYTVPIWAFWCIVWIWPNKFIRFFNSDTNGKNDTAIIDKNFGINKTYPKTEVENTSTPNITSTINNSKKMIEEEKSVGHSKFDWRWTILFILNYFFASFYFFFDPLLEVLKIDMGVLFGVLGIFIAFMFIPWTIAIINRLARKKKSGTGLFVAYYSIFIFFVVMILRFRLALISYLNLDLTEFLTGQKRIGFTIATSLFSTFIIILVMIFIKNLSTDHSK